MTQMKKNMIISQQDVARLIREPSSHMRGEIVRKVAGGFLNSNYGEREVELAIEIFRLLLRDTEKHVRAVLAEELKDSMRVPADIISSLAHDEAEVATPILQFSYVLSEDELIEIVKATREVPKLMAVAQRESLSAALSHELILSGEQEVVKTVIRNKGAQVQDPSLEYVLDEYYQDHSVLEELVYRGNLPFVFAEKLFSLVSDELKTQLTKKYRLSSRLVDNAAESAKQAAMMGFLSPHMSESDVVSMVDKMYASKRLDESAIIRALCVGDLRFFEVAMARLVGIPVCNARLLLMDPGALGFKSFYESSGLPDTFYPPIKVLYDAAMAETDAGRYQIDDFADRMIQRISTESDEAAVDHMPYVIGILKRSMHERPHVH